MGIVVISAHKAIEAPYTDKYMHGDARRVMFDAAESTSCP
jgi:hypothetical protein